MVAIVTGAAQGIGRAIAESLGSAGADIVLGDLQASGAAVALVRAMGVDAVEVRIDTGKRADADRLVAAAIDRFGRVDVLVNNAAIDAPEGNIMTLSENEWRRTIDVNLSGVFFCAQAVAPIMVRQGGGSIVNISSQASYFGAPHLSPAYNASKAGVLGLTLALAAQLGGDGVRVNAIAPGAVLSRDFGWSASETKAQAERHILGLGEPADVAHAVRYLASPAARWVTASVMHVHGGFLQGRSVL
jgi:3-oxoacyl-[acyl-carrier protein] reductase